MASKDANSDYVCMDGNCAAVTMGYKMSDAACIYPITPSSPMGQYADEWLQHGRTNIFGTVTGVQQMQSEAGASGALHGAAVTGALTTTFTCSQGLLLMIPNMYKLAGELIPTVFHVAARMVASNAMNIYSDHSDVMACRNTGFSMLSATSVQETLDFAALAHLSSVKAGLPFLHFFDGMRTSHEVNKIRPIPDSVLETLFDWEALSAWRNSRVMSNEHPTAIGGVWGRDTHWQTREAAQPLFDAVPGIVQGLMDRFAELTGRRYNCFDYVGSPVAEHVIVMMGSGASTAEEAVKYLVQKGEAVGLVKVRLFRSWSDELFLKALPPTVRRIAVLDKTLELAASGEPVFFSVVASIVASDREGVMVCGGSYGIGGKEFNPAHALAVYNNLALESPRLKFTVGLHDDVNFLSLPVPPLPNTVPANTTQCLFYALGADGTVGANKNAISIIGENTELFAQGYFCYDAKKSGGFTVSHLRFGPEPLAGAYEIAEGHADFVACHQRTLMGKLDMAPMLREGGTFVVNAPWKTAEDMGAAIPNKVKRKLAEVNAKVFCIDADELAVKVGLKGRINMIMNTVFFKLSEVLPFDRAVDLLEAAVKKTYAKFGAEVIAKNVSAIEAAVDGLVLIEVPKAAWSAVPEDVDQRPKGHIPYVTEVLYPTQGLHGVDLPVSKFKRLQGGLIDVATSRYEKRGITDMLPTWDMKKCIQCNQCVAVCPHACIRPFIATQEEVDKAPEGFETVPLKGCKTKGLLFRIQLSPLDCVNCGACVSICPKNCLAMERNTKEQIKKRDGQWEYAIALPNRSDLFDRFTFRGSQFAMPLIEFTAACGGCAEVPYAKLLTQLFGEDTIVANACGCSMVWSGYQPSSPWRVNPDKGDRGTVYCGTLFEDAAENGVGMALSVAYRRIRLVEEVEKLLRMKDQVKDPALTPEVVELLTQWLVDKDNREKCNDHVVAAQKLLKGSAAPTTRLLTSIFENIDLMAKRIVWVIGGDGWAYDIGYGGLDHVLSMGADVNVLILDTEVYSNTGGQKSKATPRGAVAGFAARGQSSRKKDMGMLMMSTGTSYVASVALAASPKQCVSAFVEAEQFNGPSIVLAFCPCLAHGIAGGLGNSPVEEQLAVDTGYWPLYRFNPAAAAKKKRLIIDSKLAPKRPLKDLIQNENRFKTLQDSAPEIAAELQALLEEDVSSKLQALGSMKARLDQEGDDSPTKSSKA